MKPLLTAITIAALCGCFTSCANKYGSAEVGYYKPALPFEDGAQFGAFVQANPEAILEGKN